MESLKAKQICGRLNRPAPSFLEIMLFEYYSGGNGTLHQCIIKQGTLASKYHKPEGSISLIENSLTLLYPKNMVKKYHPKIAQWTTQWILDFKGLYIPIWAILFDCE